jgi:glycosyltransferase involved in cell wall biosynthesis
MVAAWADIKRHWRVFRALGRLARRGHRMKVALVGYRYDRSMADIAALARHFGIGDQVELHEYIPPEAVNALLARSKVHVLWSRRECANRAIIEAMLANVPVIVRKDMTFGFPYPYINAQTGRFVAERDLEEAILDMVQHRDAYAPRDWVLANMTCEKASMALEEHLERAARTAGERWTSGLTVKTSGLYGMQYYVPSERNRFDADYQFLESALVNGR